MVLSLYVVKPASDTEECLICCKELLCLGDVYEAYGLQKLHAI